MDGRDRLCGRDLALACTIPLVLLLIASVAVVRYHRVEQSSWQGVGFGMFASYEYTLSRTIRVTTATGERISIPGDLADEAERVMTAPGDHETVALAKTLLERSGADRLVLEVWGHDVEGHDQSLVIGFRLLRRVEVP